MTLNFKRNAGAALNYYIFGKLPRRSDFVRVNASHPSAVSLDLLIAESLKRLQHDSRFTAAYRSMSATNVVLRRKDTNQLFLGAMQPSHDEAGRDYPLVAGTFHQEGPDIPLLSHVILAKELFFNGLKEQLASAIENSVEMLACKDFLDEQSRFNACYDADLDLARQLLERHMRNTSVTQLNQMLCENQMGSLDVALLSFIFQQQLVNKFASSMPSQVFLLPLPERDGEDVLFAAMWLALYLAATANVSKHTEQFLMLNTPSGRFLVLAPGALTYQHFSICWGVPIESSHQVDVSEDSAPWKGDKAYAEAAYVLGRRLSDPAMSTAELCDVIRNISLSVG